jgi:hypothetical protein
MRTLQLLRFAAAAFAGTALASCGTGGTSTPVAPVAQATPTPASTFSLRAIHGSPDAGPVDIYVYASTSTAPSKPTIANLQYPGITGYLSLPVGTYTVAIDKAGTTTQIATETVTGTASQQLSSAVAGQVATSTVQLQNFVEPAETAGVSALIVHHASPAVNAAVSPVGVGVYSAASTTAPTAALTDEVFAFALATATATTPGLSGPAASGSVSGGEFFIAPIPSTLPAQIGFAAGAPAMAGGPLGSVAASATLSGLATALNTAGYGLSPLETTLAQDTGETVPAGAHLSIFAVDSTTSAPGILIGTLDP